MNDGTNNEKAILQGRREKVVRMVEEQLPELAKAVKSDETGLILHQDAFAADYQSDELILLGAAIKYAGMAGKEIRIHGRNRETIERAEADQVDLKIDDWKLKKRI